MTLSELFKSIADAIRGKDGTTDSIAASDFATRIEAIETGIDTSDATATAGDLPEGVTAYVNGEKITGTVTESTSFVVNGTPMESPNSSEKFALRWRGYNDYLFRDGNHYFQAPKTDFGDATAADVASGKTFTSAAGLKVTGTCSNSGESFVTVDYEDSVSNLNDNITINTDADAIIFQPPDDIDISTMTGVENFCVRITASDTANSEYRDFYILNLNISNRNARYFYAYWTGASNPNSSSATMQNSSRGYCTTNFDETTGVFTIESNSYFFSGFSNPSIYARITYKL